jgi:hypothetical protein
MARNIKARRKLSDLYAVGVEVRFDSTGGHIGPFDTPATEDQVAMWVQPPNSFQRDMALRNANSARARAQLRINRKDEDSEEYTTALAFVSEMSDESLIEYILEVTSDTRQNEAIRDVLGKDEWKDFSALQDAMRQYDELETEPDEDDPEWAELLAADIRYGQQVRERMKELTEADRESLSILSRDSWEKRAISRRAELITSQIFVIEYERQMTYYSVRDVDNHDDLFFESVREYIEQPDEVQITVANALKTFINDTAEAKNLSGAAPGSAPSEPPSAPETSESSIPEELTV